MAKMMSTKVYAPREPIGMMLGAGVLLRMPQDGLNKRHQCHSASHTLGVLQADESATPETLTTRMTKLIGITYKWSLKNLQAPPNSEDGRLLSVSLRIGMARRRVLRASADVLGSSIESCAFPGAFLEDGTRVLSCQMQVCGDATYALY